ncbi:hypothetical protein TrLO_g15459 [Triparma laevis f. longispina]|uniref:Uncharacterized protein n=1 Tax=Triparma laevis f. longispina TaxID=1714387 RepID=A0A9W7CH44_9STRA|nr:hypothetical protein TrLO_g15459 [Triparma laevis f. longispina]
MSQKRVATRSSSRLKAQNSGGESGGEDGESQNQGQGQGPLDAVLAPTTKDDFMATDDFMRLPRGYVDVADLFYTFRLRIAELEKIVAALTSETAAQTTVIATLTTENEEQATEIAALTTEVAALKIANDPSHTDDFISTIDFKRHFVGFVHVEMLLVLREVSKEWNVVVEERVNESVECGEMIVHGGKDIIWHWQDPREERRKRVTRVIFLLNITKVGDYTCAYAINLVVFDIPEGVGSIGLRAFKDCTSLTKVSFPTTLTSIGWYAFQSCSSLDNVVLRHTNLQELGSQAFAYCFELKSMTIPNSLQTLDTFVFYGCSKLVPSKIDVNDINNYDQDAVIAHLCSQQQQ